MKKQNDYMLYSNCQKYVKDKDRSARIFIDSALNKTQQIFRYENLPDTTPQMEIENILQTNGHGAFITHENNLWFIRGDYSGEVDAYNKPRFYTISNVFLNLFKTYEIGKDCVVVSNDFKNLGLLPVIKKFACLSIDAEISLNTVAILNRISMLISAPDDKTKMSAEIFINRILNGDFSVIGENSFFDGVKIHSGTTTNNNLITQLIELTQYYKATFLNDIGLQANYNMKRERLTAGEVSQTIDNLLPLIDNMYNCRKIGIESVNEMFGCDIIVDYNSAWKNTHENADRELLYINTPDEDETETETAQDAEEPDETETETAQDAEEQDETETETTQDAEEQDETETETTQDAEEQDAEEQDETEKENKGGKKK